MGDANVSYIGFYTKICLQYTMLSNYIFQQKLKTRSYVKPEKNLQICTTFLGHYQYEPTIYNAKCLFWIILY